MDYEDAREALAHPLVTLLAEALAVTDPERPPWSAEVSGGEVRLEWDEPADVGLTVTCNEPPVYASNHHSNILFTNDPAEARAWLAAALEVSNAE